jgi:hypothetical protein
MNPWDDFLKLAGGLVLMSILVPMFILALGLFTAIPVMYCWNMVVPDVFGYPEIGYWQAFAMYTVGRLLFGNSSAPPQTNK